MVLELAEVTRERDVLGPRDVLIAEEEHAVLEQQRANLGDEAGVARRDTEVDVEQLGADRAGQRLDLDRGEAGGAHDGGRCGGRNGHGPDLLSRGRGSRPSRQQD
jgi:hypothetical protein